MKINVLLVAPSALCFSLVSQSVTAQSLSLKLDSNGAVTIDASDVTVDEILARWSETTGLTVVSQNGRGSDIPVTLHLSGVSEREALGIVLRDLSGYIMGERRDPTTGSIRIDRLIILPESAAKPFDVERLPRARPMPVPQATTDEVPEIPMELAPVVEAPADVAEP